MKNVRVNIKIILTRIIFSVLGFISISCIESPLSPVAPSSDIVLQGISVIDITSYFRDLERKASGATINSDSSMSFTTTQYSTPRSIDSIKMQMNPSAQQVGVGLFGIDALPSTSQNPTLAQLGLSPIEYPGANPPFIPPFPASYVSIPGDTINFSSQFDYAAINSGTLTLQFVNNLPLRLTFNKPIILRNNQLTPFLDTSWIAYFNPGTIDSNGMPLATYTGTQSLSGKIMRSRMKFDSVSFTTEERSTKFSLKSSNGLSVQFSSTSLTADSAAAVVPQQTLTSINDSSVVVDDSVIVQNATFSAGSFKLIIVNNLGIDVGAHFVINQLHKSGLSYTYDETLAGKTTDTTTIIASQLSIQPDVKPNTGIGAQLTYSVGIKTIDSKGAKKPITKNDFVKASLIPGPPLVLKSISGKIKTQTLDINSMVASGLDFKDVKNVTLDAITFKDVVLTVRFPMTGGYPMDYNLTLIARSKGFSVDSLRIVTGQDGFTRIFPNNPVIAISNVPNFQRFLSKFVPVAPDSFYIRGTVILNPDFATAGIYSTYDSSKIYPAFDVNFPMFVGLSNGKLTNTSGFTKAELPKEFTKAVTSGSLNFNFVNKIPLKMFCALKFVGNYSTSKPKGDTILTIVPSDSIAAGQIDQTTGYSLAPTVSKVSITLNGDQMSKFNAADSLNIQFSMSTSGGFPVKIRAMDYIRVYAKADITYTMNKQ